MNLKNKTEKHNQMFLLQTVLVLYHYMQRSGYVCSSEQLDYAQCNIREKWFHPLTV